MRSLDLGVKIGVLAGSNSFVSVEICHPPFELHILSALAIRVYSRGVARSNSHFMGNRLLKYRVCSLFLSCIYFGIVKLHKRRF